MIVGENTKYLATLDRAFDFEKKAFTYARKVETQYAVALRSIALHRSERGDHGPVQRVPEGT